MLLSELSIEIWTISPKGHSLSGRKRELHLEAVYGGGFAATRLRAMELITISGFEEDTADSKDAPALLHFDRRLRLFRLRRLHFLSSY